MMLKRFFSRSGNNEQSNASNNSTVITIPATNHSIHPDEINPKARKITQTLNEAGFKAYLVGGVIRDLLLGLHPKDFDIATDARPEQIKALFKNSRIVGRRFRLVHIMYGREIIEVATFRAECNGAEKNNDQQKRSAGGQILRDNTYGSVEEDALRRDFTVNALYLDPNNLEIFDYTQGISDLKNKTLRLIGDPILRYQEDPVRMLRAVRFASKLDFQLCEASAKPIYEAAELLSNIPPARLFDENLKLFLNGYAYKNYHLLQQFGLFQQLYPATQEALDHEPNFQKLIDLALINTDRRIDEGKSVTPAFLLAVFLWRPMRLQEKKLKSSNDVATTLRHHAGQDILYRQRQRMAIPKRYAMVIREIWDYQLRLPNRYGLRAEQMLQQKRFRAAYDFLLLLEQAGEIQPGLGQWWTDFQVAEPRKRKDMVQALAKPKRRRKRKSHSSSSKP